MTAPRRTPEGLEVPTRFTVSPHPKGHPDRDKAAVYVEYIGDGQAWAITHPERGHLSRHRQWSPVPAPEDMTPEWKKEHGFMFVRAMHEARNLLGIPHPPRRRR